MNARPLRTLLLSAACSLSLLAAHPTSAALFRAYVSQNGSDANPCTLQQPCRLLPKALAAIDSGGEIWMLDSANYNSAPVSITKSVTILAIPGALGSVVATGGDAIDVASAGAEVTLRNLVVLNFAPAPGAHGIKFTQGARLTVEECEIYGLPGDGIRFTAAPAALTVKNTTIRNGGGAGVYVAGSAASQNSASLEHVTLLSLATGVSVAGSANLTIASSLIAYTTTGVSGAESGGQGTRMTIDNTVIRQNATAIALTSPTATDTVRATLSRTVLTNNNTGINVQSASGDAKATLDNDVIQHNATAINMSGGVVFTRGNNTMNFFTNDVVGGTLTPLGAI